MQVREVSLCTSVHCSLHATNHLLNIGWACFVRGEYLVLASATRSTLDTTKLCFTTYLFLPDQNPMIDVSPRNRCSAHTDCDSTSKEGCCTALYPCKTSPPTLTGSRNTNVSSSIVVTSPQACKLASVRAACKLSCPSATRSTRCAATPGSSGPLQPVSQDVLDFRMLSDLIASQPLDDERECSTHSSRRGEHVE